MSEMLTLDQAPVGATLRVLRINDPETATQAVRLGIADGEIIRLASKVPGGPVVIHRGAIEIALGRALCRDIQVEAYDAAKPEPTTLKDPLLNPETPVQPGEALS